MRRWIRRTCSAITASFEKAKKDTPMVLSSAVTASPEIGALIRTVTPYTLTCPLRLSTLHGLVCELQQESVAGDIVECGVFKGGSAAIMAAGARGTTARLWLYDTFAGLPATTEKDGPLAVQYVGTCNGSVEATEEVLQKVGFPAENTVIRRGLFSQTFEEALPDQVSLLHIDADWYESVLLALTTFYPRVSIGGIIVLDDFGYWEGCRRAFYEFCKKTGTEPLLERIGQSQAFWKKGVEHARMTPDHYVAGYYRAVSALPRGNHDSKPDTHAS
jgi:O-methyltransferase